MNCTQCKTSIRDKVIHYKCSICCDIVICDDCICSYEDFHLHPFIRHKNKNKKISKLIYKLESMKIS